MLVFMFPGQSSRDPLMLERVIDAWPAAARIVERACDVLGRDLRDLYASPAGDVFARNRDVQVGVFLASILHRAALEEMDVRADLSLGLSLGEYAHLVDIGALDFEDALRLVEARGNAYDRGPEGMMTSVFPVDEETLAPYVEAARAQGPLEIANFNSPSQQVIAGVRPAVEEAMRLIEEGEPAAQCVVIEKRIPMHTQVFRPVADDFAAALRSASWKAPRKPYIPNVSAEILDAPGAIAPFLERHVYSPVQWRRSIDAVVARHPQARFVEVGPGSVLHNLLQRGWHRNRRYRSDGPEGLLARRTAASELADAA